jgi:hypothetical protein
MGVCVDVYVWVVAREAHAVCGVRRKHTSKGQVCVCEPSGHPGVETSRVLGPVCGFSRLTPLHATTLT